MGGTEGDGEVVVTQNYQSSWIPCVNAEYNTKDSECVVSPQGYVTSFSCWLLESTQSLFPTGMTKRLKVGPLGPARVRLVMQEATGLKGIVMAELSTKDECWIWQWDAMALPPNWKYPIRVEME